ncbi:hypothetical protein ACFVYE_15235 [Streptomyces sp. NPDC058239]|uniref:hypothetical protein n=1 Tax=Streptomyces sp. NPDC058239 TaxID=3346395 RepID=UPI0036EA54A7
MFEYLAEEASGAAGEALLSSGADTEDHFRDRETARTGPGAMTAVPTVVVIGGGSLAASVCAALATAAGPPLQVVVAARGESVGQLCGLAGTRAALAGRAVRFRPRTTGPDMGAALPEVIRQEAPDGVLLCASHQSPWERRGAPSAWTALLGRGGFGLTLPLQADLAVVAGRAAAECGSWFVNACFPDAVNPVLAALRVPVLCGIGNVALLAASLQARLGLPDQRRLRVVGHHVHLNPPGPAGEALGWLDDEPLDGVTAALAGQRACDRSALNQVTGQAGAMLIDALASGSELDTSLPGVAGLPGGYPVRISGGRVTLRLPAGLSRAEAVAANQRWSQADGIVVEGGRVRFAPAAAAALAEAEPGWEPGEFPAERTPDVCRRLLALRERLRRTPAGPSAVPKGNGGAR